MLRARLYRGDLYQDFSPLSDGWILGRKSTITPLKNPFLKPVMYQCSDAIAFGVMEIWFVNQTAGDGILIVLPKAQCTPPSFHRTAHTSVPLFISIELESVTL